MASFICVDGLDIHKSLDCLVLKQDSIASNHITRHCGNFTAVFGACCFDHSDTSKCDVSTVVKPRNLHAHKNALLNESHTFDQLSLDELFSSHSFSELNTFESVLESCFTGARRHTSCDPCHKDTRMLKHFFGARCEVSCKFEAFVVGHKYVAQDDVRILNSPQ